MVARLQLVVNRGDIPHLDSPRRNRVACGDGQEILFHDDKRMLLAGHDDGLVFANGRYLADLLHRELANAGFADAYKPVAQLILRNEVRDFHEETLAEPLGQLRW
jgi:hypothetical protein